MLTTIEKTSPPKVIWEECVTRWLLNRPKVRQSEGLIVPTLNTVAHQHGMVRIRLALGFRVKVRHRMTIRIRIRASVRATFQG